MVYSLLPCSRDTSGSDVFEVDYNIPPQEVLLKTLEYCWTMSDHDMDSSSWLLVALCDAMDEPLQMILKEMSQRPGYLKRLGCSIDELRLDESNSLIWKWRRDGSLGHLYAVMQRTANR